MSYSLEPVEIADDSMERFAALIEALARLHASNPLYSGLMVAPAIPNPRPRYFAFARVKGKRSLSLKHRANRRKAVR